LVGGDVKFFFAIAAVGFKEVFVPLGTCLKRHITKRGPSPV
jgi:hypothetical protein